MPVYEVVIERTIKQHATVIIEAHSVEWVESIVEKQLFWNQIEFEPAEVQWKILEPLLM